MASGEHMLVRDCTIGAEYVINDRVWLLIGRGEKRAGIFADQGDSMTLSGDLTVYEVIWYVDERWCLWHEGCRDGIEVHHFNHNVWIRVRDL